MLPIDHIAYINAYKNIHPVEKGIFSFSFLFFCILFKDPVSAVIVFLLMSMAIVKGAKVPFRYYLTMLFFPFVFLFLSVITILISVAPANVELEDLLLSMMIGNWQWYISTGNLQRVIQLLFSVLAGISCMYFFILTTPIQQIIWLLQKVKLPSLFIELFVLTYRFIFVLMKSMNEIRTAQVSRLGYRRYRQSITSLGQLIIGVLLKSVKGAKEFQMATDARGNGEMLEVEINLSYNRRNWLTISSLFLLLCMMTVIF